MDDWDKDYEIVVSRLNGPAESDCHYWHLFHRGLRINGGITEGTAGEAKQRAEYYRTAHSRNVILTSHYWDSETANWIPKAGLNIM